jgi:hypothetical protein
LEQKNSLKLATYWISSASSLILGLWKTNYLFHVECIRAASRLDVKWFAHFFNLGEHGSSLSLSLIMSRLENGCLKNGWMDYISLIRKECSSSLTMFRVKNGFLKNGWMDSVALICLALWSSLTTFRFKNRCLKNEWMG